MKHILIPLLLQIMATRINAESSQQPPAPEIPGFAPHCANPILPGYYADPSLLQDGKSIYIYATLDPWGDETLGCWESADFKNWTYRVLNWPTKSACTSPTSQASKIWAPSVVRGKDGKFYMYVSVGSEVWVGTADHPLGPWRNLLAARPLIPANYKPGFHMIDAEAFIDDDGAAYLYWGSGLNWVNGRCWAAKLNAGMAGFDGEVKDVTPARYFEGPFMLKHGGRYYLMNSTGKTTADTYQVRYAVGDNPFGPFAEPADNSVLAGDKANNVLSPGHHAVFTQGGQTYILYGRHSIPFDPKSISRQTCVDRLDFTPDGLLAKVVPTHAGPPLVQGRADGRCNLAASAAATASSQSAEYTGPGRVLDDNYATRWAAAADALGAWLQLDLGASQRFTRQELRPEYAWKPCPFTVEISDDASQWKTLEDHRDRPAVGSPIILTTPASARYVRLVFPESVKGSDIAFFEWAIY